MSSPENGSPGKRLGLGMLTACLGFSLLALTYFFNDILDNRVNPNRNPQTMETSSGVREVLLERNRQGHYVAGGTVNNVPVTFLLDTGATDVAIPEHIAEEADLIPGYRSQATTANGVVDVYTTEVGQLTIGNIVFQNIRASITPSMMGDTILLGMSALQHVEFTQRGSTLTLRQIPQ